MPFGEYEYSVDDKGRVVIPVGFRSFLGDTMVATRGPEGAGCIRLFSQANWGKIEDQLKKIPLTDADRRRFIHFLYSSAQHLAVDRQGRVLLPQTLREHAGVPTDRGGDVTILGEPDAVAIWSRDRWKDYLTNVQQEIKDQPERFAGILGSIAG